MRFVNLLSKCREAARSTEKINEKNINVKFAGNINVFVIDIVRAFGLYTYVFHYLLDVVNLRKKKHYVLFFFTFSLSTVVSFPVFLS